MSKLNKDILYLIFKILQDDKYTLFLFLLINKTFCEIIIPILWKNPWKTRRRNHSLLEIIISNLSKESKDNIITQNYLKNLYQKPLFNYISFCKYLDLNKLERMIIDSFSNFNIFKVIEISIIFNEIFKIFFNENTKFTHLYVSNQFKFQNPEVNHCFS